MQKTAVMYERRIAEKIKLTKTEVLEIMEKAWVEMVLVEKEQSVGINKIR